jgi:hypothetical protein
VDLHLIILNLCFNAGMSVDLHLIILNLCFNAGISVNLHLIILDPCFKCFMLSPSRVCYMFSSSWKGIGVDSGIGDVKCCLVLSCRSGYVCMCVWFVEADAMGQER